MNHSHHRSTPAAIFAALFITVLVVFATSAHALVPIDAHHPIISGLPSCSTSDPSEHVIDWTIGNSQPKKAMSITSATAELNGASYAVTGYVNPIAPSGSTTAQTTIPGDQTGTVTMWVHAQWTDGHLSQRHVTLDLPDPCTTAVTTTTTAPGTTTPPGVTTTTVKRGTTVPPSISSPAPPTGTDGGQLAFTGGPSWMFIGIAMIALGLGAFGLLIAPRRPRVE